MRQQVVNHSTYRRGQIAGLLRHLGRVPRPTDCLVYLDDVAAGAGSATAD